MQTISNPVDPAQYYEIHKLKEIKALMSIHLLILSANIIFMTIIWSFAFNC